MKHFRSSLFSVSACLALAFVPPAHAAEPVPMSAEDLITLTRVAAPAAMPDGRRVVWQQTETDRQSYQRTTGLWQATPDTPQTPVRLVEKGSDPAFNASGVLYYLAPGKPAGGGEAVSQVWRMAGATALQVTAFATDVNGFKLSPDGKRLLVWGDIARDCPTFGCAKDGNVTLPGPGTGRLYRDGTGFVRHWDHWETPGNYSRAFVFDLGTDGRVADKAIALDGPVGILTGDTPSKPMGGGEELAWAADSRSVFFAARQADRHEPTSTNLDIWHSALDGKAPRNLTESNRGTDTFPAVSPDGRWLAWGAMARPGYEADRVVVHLRDLKTGATRALTAERDRSVGSITWTPDSRAVVVTANDVLDNLAFRVDIADGKVTHLPLAPKGQREGHLAISAVLADGRLLYTRDSASSPPEVWLARPGQAQTPVSNANIQRLAAMAPLESQRFSFSGALGDKVYGMVHKLAGAPAKQPVLLIVHGGPQGTMGDSWSFRWNPRVFASQGYAVVTIDFHGSTGYGQAFTDSINRDWGGKPLEDLKLGLAAALARDPSLDGTRVCALGASYGGYMMNWIAGQWPDRFKCLVNHNGVFDARAMAYTTEEQWFDEWEHGGKTYWQAPEEYERWNPVNHVDKWQTPMLIVLGERDFRIPYTQGLGAFQAMQRRGVPSELLVFPDENHWVLKPRNSLQWHQTVFGWLARWLKQP